MKEFADVVMLVEAPGNNFLEKLTFQLKEIKATPDTYQLIAEALWVMYLPCGPSFIRPHAKKDTIKKLWEIPRAESSAKFLDEKYLQNEYMGGFAHPGTAFGLNIWAELLTFLLFALTVKTGTAKSKRTTSKMMTVQKLPAYGTSGRDSGKNAFPLCLLKRRRIANSAHDALSAVPGLF